MAVPLGFLDPDRAARPSWRQLRRDVAGCLRPGRAPDPASLPAGCGSPVLVVPGFLCTDLVTLRLRRYLARCGFQPFGWGLGVNWGPTPRLQQGLAHRVATLHAAHGPIAIIGISLGGTMARALAHAVPEQVRHLVTVASPVVLPIATTLAPVVARCARQWDDALDLGLLSLPLPIPSTVLWTQDDGIVAPANCRVAEPLGQLVALSGPHLTLAGSPAGLRAIVQAISPAA